MQEIDTDKHWQFLEDELIAITEKFEKKFSAQAHYLLQTKNEMYVGQFVGLKNGELCVLLPKTRSIPRKNEHLYCMLLPETLRSYKNWGDMTYEDLFSKRFKGSEVVCAWNSASTDPRCYLVGFSHVEMEFVTTIQNTPGLVLVFAPAPPPIEYIANLQNVINLSDSTSSKGLLDSNLVKREWKPELITGSSPADFVYNKLEHKNRVILQGPPGTGKTYLIAELCRRFLNEGKSVLVTALTNRALMEVAEKQSLKTHLKCGRISKTSLTATEKNEIKDLCDCKDIYPNISQLILATFYKSSGYASRRNPMFDVVIMDEASQAFTSTFVATCLMGRNLLWVGDTRQLSPIVEQNEDHVIKSGYLDYINGMEYVASHLNETVYQLTETWRFGQRAADFTGLFYNNSLCSRLEHQYLLIPPALAQVLNPKGGPVLIKQKMSVGDNTPIEAIDLAIRIVKDILNSDHNKEIAILTHKVQTVKAIQTNLHNYGINSHNVLSDTVARVQGLTTDIVIYLITNTAYYFSLEPHLFNVATSRAREHTVIIADESIINSASSPEVRKFLNQLL